MLFWLGFSFQTWFSVENIGDDMVEDERRKGILSMIHQVGGSVPLLEGHPVHDSPGGRVCALVVRASCP